MQGCGSQQARSDLHIPRFILRPPSSSLHQVYFLSVAEIRILWELYWGEPFHVSTDQSQQRTPSSFCISELNINNQFTLQNGRTFTHCVQRQCLSAPVAYLKSRTDLFWSRELLISKRQLAGSSVVAANKDPRCF